MLKEDCLYHVSMDLSLEEKEFIPRIPKYRCDGENDTIKRICVCPTLKDALGAFPYKGYYVNNLMTCRNENYLVYYEIPKNEVIYKTDLEINDLVPDAHITKEHWILNSFKAKPNLIKLNKFVLSNYNKYINEYSGFVKELEYENSTEDYDREVEYIFIDKEFSKKAINFAINNNISYEIIEDSYYHLWYKRFVIKDMKYNGTTKRYRWQKIKFNIPKGTDIADLWIINDKQYKFIDRKNIRLQPFIVDESNREDLIEYLMYAGGGELY